MELPKYSDDQLEFFIKWLSITALLIGGAIFVYEGMRYINLKQQNPSIPNKIYGAAVVAILLGVLSITFGIIHIWW